MLLCALPVPTVNLTRKDATRHTDRDPEFSLACDQEVKGYHPEACIPLMYLGHLQLTSMDLLCWPGSLLHPSLCCLPQGLTHFLLGDQPRTVRFEELF